MPISLSTHNILADKSHKATYTVSMPNDNASSAMSRARVSFIGVSFLVVDRGYELIPEHHGAGLRRHPAGRTHASVVVLPLVPPRCVVAARTETAGPARGVLGKVRTAGYLLRRRVWRVSVERSHATGSLASLTHSTHYIGHIPVELYANAGKEDYPGFTVQA